MALPSLESIRDIPIGPQEVDGLKPLGYLRSLAAETVEDDLLLDAVGRAIRADCKLRDESGDVTDAGE